MTTPNELKALETEWNAFRDTVIAAGIGMPTFDESLKLHASLSSQLKGKAKASEITNWKPTIAKLTAQLEQLKLVMPIAMARAAELKKRPKT